MIEVGNKNEKNKNKDRWNYCHHMPILPLLENMDKHSICLEATGERIN